MCCFERGRSTWTELVRFHEFQGMLGSYPVGSCGLARGRVVRAGLKCWESSSQSVVKS